MQCVSDPCKVHVYQECRSGRLALNQSLLTEGVKEVKRWIGCSFLLTSRSMVVLGCQSSNASRRCANSRAKKCATLSSAIMSRRDHGICRCIGVNTMYTYDSIGSFIMSAIDMYTYWRLRAVNGDPVLSHDTQSPTCIREITTRSIGLFRWTIQSSRGVWTTRCPILHTIDLITQPRLHKLEAIDFERIVNSSA